MLAAVFATAGVAKILDTRGTKGSLVGFGVPPGSASIVARLLPLAELAVAVTLIPVSSARWGAIGAGALLLTFAAGIANALARGRTPDCHCFGSLHSAPAGRATLARNLGLAAVAGVVAFQGPDTEVGEWVAARTTAELVAVGIAAAALALAALSLRLWKENRRLKRALVQAREAREPEPEGLPVGMPAPSFELQSLAGEAGTLESLRAGDRPVLLAFLDPSCGPCHLLAPHLARWQATLRERVAICAISEGDPERVRAAWGSYGLEVLLDPDSEVTRRAYRVLTWPSALAIGPGGTIAHELVYSQDAMEALLRALLRGPLPSRPPQLARVMTVSPAAIEAE